jgi:hypothetical protein
MVVEHLRASVAAPAAQKSVVAQIAVLFPQRHSAVANTDPLVAEPTAQSGKLEVRLQVPALVETEQNLPVAAVHSLSYPQAQSAAFSAFSAMSVHAAVKAFAAIIAPAPLEAAASQPVPVTVAVSSVPQAQLSAALPIVMAMPLVFVHASIRAAATRHCPAPVAAVTLQASPALQVALFPHAHMSLTSAVAKAVLPFFWGHFFDPVQHLLVAALQNSEALQVAVPQWHFAKPVGAVPSTVGHTGATVPVVPVIEH